ncbi:hypothetical protein RF11_09764 [Thelohanellus kitauei]|uniref:Uncharacterized protein n=1 Tax=Thelohanellus kitauei TaxID=669202 RepID=A0A0C2JCL8_THEKT|nr:hypothetical protein RF11_09764 [Thelohanellus kitauei]
MGIHLCPSSAKRKKLSVPVGIILNTNGTYEVDIFKNFHHLLNANFLGFKAYHVEFIGSTVLMLLKEGGDTRESQMRESDSKSGRMLLTTRPSTSRVRRQEGNEKTEEAPVDGIMSVYARQPNVKKDIFAWESFCFATLPIVLPKYLI